MKAIERRIYAKFGQSYITTSLPNLIRVVSYFAAAAVVRKIQLTLAPPPEPTNAEGMEQKQGATTSIKEEKTPVVIIPPKPPTTESYKSFKI